MIAATLILLFGGATKVLAQSAAGYCEGNGGAAGAVTDAEHDVLVGDPALPRGVRSSLVRIAGVTTRVQEAGPPDARTAVLFLHGHPGSSRDWDALVAATGRFGRAIAFDFPGYGKSEKTEADLHSVEGGARFVGAALDRLGVERAVLGVHDFGAVWGLQWAVGAPDRLIAAVLVNSGVYINYIPHAQAWAWATPGVGEAQMASTTRESFVRGIQAQAPQPLPESFLHRMYDDYDRGTRCAALRYYRSGFENPGRGREQAEVLRRRSRPALVIWGEDDPYVPVEHAERQRQAFPDARIEILPGSGHWPFVDSPRRVRELVVSFLRPTLAVSGWWVQPGRRRARVRVRTTGALPALRVRADLRTRGNRPRRVGRTAHPVTVSGRRTLTLRLARKLRRGRYELHVRARGLPRRRLGVRVAVRPGRDKIG